MNIRLGIALACGFVGLGLGISSLWVLYSERVFDGLLVLLLLVTILVLFFPFRRRDFQDS